MSDPNWDSVSLRLPFNTDFDDVSDNAATVSQTGDPTISATAKYGAGSGAYDGNDHSEYTGISALGTNDFTAECWVRFNTTGNAIIFTLGSTGGQYFSVLRISGFIRLWSNAHLIVGPTTVIDTWYHVALTRSSGTTELYVDGVSYGTNTTARTLPVGTFVGGPSVAGITPLNGFIDDLRFTDGVVRYTTGFTPPAAELPTEGLPTNDIDGVFPAITGAFTGSVSTPSTSGDIDGTFPTITGAWTGSVSSAPVSGDIDGLLPAITGSFTGSTVTTSTSGDIDGVLPAITGAFTGSAVASVAGDIDGILPAITGSFAGQTGVVPGSSLMSITDGTTEIDLPICAIGDGSAGQQDTGTGSGIIEYADGGARRWVRFQARSLSVSGDGLIPHGFWTLDLEAATWTVTISSFANDGSRESWTVVPARPSDSRDWKSGRTSWTIDFRDAAARA